MSQTLLNILPETKRIPAAERILKPKTLAIPLLNTDATRYYSYAHTVQLLAYYYLRSSALVRDPLTTMFQDLFPLALSQCLFCALCLPSVGNWNSGTDATELIKGNITRGSKSSQGASGPSKKKLGAPSSKNTSKNAATTDDAGGSWPSRIFVC